MWEWLWLCYCLFFIVPSQTLLHQLYHQNNILTAVKIKTAVVGLIYKKALTLASSSWQQYTAGQIVNLMSADAQQLLELAISVNLLWSAPFQIIMAVVFLWKELGPSVLAGVVLLLLALPHCSQSKKTEEKPNEVFGSTSQATNWNTTWNKDPETARMGTCLSKEGHED